MKEMCFEIAQKVMEDRRKETVVICTSILKTAFLLQGYKDQQANTMAIDAMKIILKTLLNLSNKLQK